jgi:hypothetical protein
LDPADTVNVDSEGVEEPTMIDEIEEPIKTVKSCRQVRNGRRSRQLKPT